MKNSIALLSKYVISGQKIFVTTVSFDIKLLPDVVILLVSAFEEILKRSFLKVAYIEESFYLKNKFPIEKDLIHTFDL